MIIIGGVGSQPALCAGLTAVPRLVKPFDSHCVGLEELFDDIALRVVKMAVEFGSGESSEIPHPINEKHRVGDAVFLFQFVKECCSRITPSVCRKSCVQHDFRLDIDRRIEPCFLLVFKLNLFFIDSNAIWINGEVLVVVVAIGLVPVLNRCSGSANAEPLAEVTTLG